jgi:hypothetical protein
MQKYFTYSKKLYAVQKHTTIFQPKILERNVSRGTIHIFWGATSCPSLESMDATIRPKPYGRDAMPRPNFYGKGVQIRYVRFSLLHRHTIYVG